MSDIEYLSGDSDQLISNEDLYNNHLESLSDTSGSDKENQIPSSQVSTATPQKTLPHNYTPIKKSELLWLIKLLLLTAPKEP